MAKSGELLLKFYFFGSISYVGGWLNMDSVGLRGILSFRFSQTSRNGVLDSASDALDSVEDLLLRGSGLLVVFVELVDVESFEQDGDEKVEDHEIGDKCDQQEEGNTGGRISELHTIPKWLDPLSTEDAENLKISLKRCS